MPIKSFLTKVQRYKMLFIFVFLFYLNNDVFSQTINKKITFNWNTETIYKDSINKGIKILSFENVILDNTANFLPGFITNFDLPYTCEFQVEIKNKKFVTVKENFKNIENINNRELNIKTTINYKNKIPFAVVSFIPLRKNPVSREIEKLISCDIEIVIGQKIFKKSFNKRSSSSSVLETGDWYKLSFSSSGVYKIDYNYLQDMGLNPSTINPKKIKIFGNGGGMVPQSYLTDYPDDLQENAIYIKGENDNSFDKGDYILFWIQGPHIWNYNYNSKVFHHQLNYYSDESYYFLTIATEDGKRINNQQSLSSSSDYVSTAFDYLTFHEKTLKTDVTDYVKSGRDWFGETFYYTSSQNFTFNIPNIITSEPLVFESYVAARSQYGADVNYFSINVDGNNFTQKLSAVDINYYLAQFSSINKKTFSFNPTADNLVFNYIYSRPGTDASGWLNYIELNARAQLILNNGQLNFRDSKTINKGVSEFQLQSSLNSILLWDVTDIYNVKNQEFSKIGNNFIFRLQTDTLKEFVAFDESSAQNPAGVVKIQNQNLHGLKNIDMVIVTYSKFLNAANRLAEFHKNVDSLSTEVVLVSKLYNEFSSGAQDISAIRNFMKMLYDKAETEDEQPKYLLLFGDASYDYKNVLPSNTNYVPTYQSKTIYYPTSSYASDDYFGFLDDNEGKWDNVAESQYFKMDISVGRIPVTSLEQAEAMTDKIIHYSAKSSFGDWRNKIVFISDDPDDDGGNHHYFQSEKLAEGVFSGVKDMNVQKVFLDAFPQITSPNGHKYPDAHEAIIEKVNSGALVVNYIGHGGESGWAHERVLEIPDIVSWNNLDNMPLFITATCEFSRYDDPERVSAGEWVLLNSNGGGIALFTTSRVVYVSSNNALTNIIYDSNIFKKQNDGKAKTLGEIITTTKNKATFHTNTRKFILLGDPAITLAYPQNEVVTTSVPDTFKALSKVSISGEIRNNAGNKISDFNGTIYPSIFDKRTEIKTLANDPKSKVESFYVMENIIYKGKVSVKNGEFSFDFVVPKDISYQDGIGKISYYATDNSTDANGYFNDIVIGGTSDSIIEDDKRPEVTLYIGDTNFISGGLTNENPLMFAKLWDENGINTTGNGIGHELIAVLDGNEPIVLNNYYESVLNDFRKGEIKYPFKNLSAGKHTLWIKVWDVANNSATDEIEFIVRNSEKIEISNLKNVPNPFVWKTNFNFEHNIAGQDVEINLQIFDINAKLIKIIKRKTFVEGSRVVDVEWDGRDSYGKNLEQGIYIYRLILSTEDGRIATASNKMVIIN